MSNIREFRFENEGMKCFTDDGVAVIVYKRSAFEALIDVKEKGMFTELFDIAEKDDNIKVLLLINSENCCSEEEYNKFLSRISGKDINKHSLKTIMDFDDRISRKREIILLQQYIQQLIDFKKLVITGLRGRIVTPFFGLSLAADMRYASESMCFCLSHIKYGLHPSGALAYFLPRYVGDSKAMQILLDGSDIDKEKALELGLINKVISGEDFVSACIEEAKRYTKLDPTVVEKTKALLHTYGDSLSKYLEAESRFIA